MLSKPKYMLPGNLSQGAPILEPDENNNYNFSFALDGDEMIERYRYKIYSLEPLELAKEDIKLSFDDFYVDSTPLKELIKLKHIEVAVDDERNINFLARFDFPKATININEEKYSQNNFLLSQYVGTIPFNFSITVSKWGVLFYLNHNYKFDTSSTWRTPILNIFKDGESNEFSELTFTGTSKLKFGKDENENTTFISETNEIVGYFSYSYNDFHNIQKKGNPYVIYNEEEYRPWCDDKTFYKITLSDGTIVSRSKDIKTYFNKIITLDDTPVYYYSAYYDDRDNEIYPKIDKYPEKLNTFGRRDGWGKSAYENEPSAFFFEFAPYDDDNYYVIKNTSLEINLKKSEQNLFLENEHSFNKMPKNQKGQYNFITFEVSKYLSGSSYDDNSGLTIPPGHYCWGTEILKKNSFNEYEIIATSNYYHFDVFENKKECSLFIDKSRVSIYINDITNNSPYLLDYFFEISNDKVLFYKSPWINSNNSTIIFPFKYFPFEIGYSTTFTTTNLEQKTLSENDFFYSLKSEKYNKIIEFKEENEKISLKSEKEIKNLSIFRVNKNNDKIIFIKKISLESSIQINIDDMGNNFFEYYYYLINDDTGEWQYSLDEVDEETGEINPVYHLNKNLDRWRLILTKGEKNDIIEEKRMCHYQVDKIYDFYYNLVSGSIGNNVETTVNTNFTSMPSVQKGFSNYWSGSLSALMGVCDEQGEFAQTIEQEKALEQLVLDQEHDKFLLDREGNIWQVEISTPLTIANQDGLVQVDKLIDLKTITINWVQVGSPTQIVFDFEE